MQKRKFICSTKATPNKTLPSCRNALKKFQEIDLQKAVAILPLEAK